MPDPAAVARAVLDRNRHLTLATADDDGRAWASPVWFATAIPGTAQAVYQRAAAAQADDPDGIEVFSRAVVDDGLSAWTMADVTGDAELRLYRAEATEVSVLGTTPGGRDERVPVDLAVAG
jgi:pyridoxamine 5'-phosphate oxidase-like protein